MCEQEPPEAVLALLNDFYERACAIVERHGGHVNKFLGDGVLAIFGAPEANPRHADSAAAAARDLVCASDELAARGGIWERVRVGIGLDTGDVIVGTVGARNRLEYTAIGTVVNRAARLQALSSAAARRVILSDDCADLVRQHAPVALLGRFEVKGFTDPIAVYALPEARPASVRPAGA
jgi:adenylate cyclase